MRCHRRGYSDACFSLSCLEMSIIKETNEKEEKCGGVERRGAAWAAQIVALNLVEVHQVVDAALENE